MEMDGLHPLCEVFVHIPPRSFEVCNFKDMCNVRGMRSVSRWQAASEWWLNLCDLWMSCQWFNEYSLKDDVGNTRVDRNGCVNDTSEVPSEAQYYPFGMKMDGPGNSESDTLQPYLYNDERTIPDELVGTKVRGKRPAVRVLLDERIAEVLRLKVY